ncbi:MAG: hypothetical protein HYS44_03500 [Candidatus Niyogibacteria bacterium]|nr:hypothetical protein [Candidatus Niyogibacteria bacterium]
MRTQTQMLQETVGSFLAPPNETIVTTPPPPLNVPPKESGAPQGESLGIRKGLPLETIPEPSVSLTPAERIIERVVSGISSSDLESLRNELNNRISSETNLLRALIAERSDSNFRAIALTNNIDMLSGVTLNSVTANSISGLTDSDIPNDITIASSAGLSGTTGSFSSTLGVTGLSTLTGGFLSSASSTINANLNVLGFLGASSTLAVSGIGTSTISYGLTIATSGGLVGIGTGTPASKLHVLNTVSGSQFRLGYDGTIFTDFSVNAAGDLTLDPAGDVYINDDNLFVCSGACPTGIPTGDGSLIVETRLGIGTSTPNWKLQVADIRPFLTLSDTSAGIDLKHWFFSSQGGNLYVGTTTDGYATTTGYQFLTMTNAGRLGIGTTSPYALLSLHTTANSVPMFAIGSTSPSGAFNSVFEVTSYGTTTVPAGSLLTASRECATNYKRVGLWCMATANILLRDDVTADESGWATSTVNAAAKMALIQVFTLATDATNAFTVRSCLAPGAISVPNCSNVEVFVQRAMSTDQTAGGAADYNTVMVQTDELGQVRTWCNVTTAADTVFCQWIILGYMD